MEEERYYRECGWEKDQIGIFCANFIPYVSSMSWVRIQPDSFFSTEKDMFRLVVLLCLDLCRSNSFHILSINKNKFYNVLIRMGANSKT